MANANRRCPEAILEAVCRDLYAQYSHVLSLAKKDGHCYECKRDGGECLIISHSEKRAKKDAYNRNHGIARLRMANKSGRITKQ